MISFFRRYAKPVASVAVVLLLLEIIAPGTAFALTSGPTQPEVQSFQPAGVSDMVDLFSGDFSYNIPLFELPGPNGGYPFNLSYQGGITMDQEASWVGLGWNLQPGSITRQMRGLPDEFNGEKVSTRMSIKSNITVGLGVGAGVEIFGGAANLGLGLGFYQNSYKGLGYTLDASIGFHRSTAGMTPQLGLGVSMDSKEGIGVNPSIGLKGPIGEIGLGVGYNSRQGLSSVSLSMDVNSMRQYKSSWSSATIASSNSPLYHASPGYTPQVSMPMKNLSLSATFRAGGSWWGIFGSPYVRGFYNQQDLKDDNTEVLTPAYGYHNYQNGGSNALLDFNREKDGMVMKESPNLPIPSLTYDVYSVTGQGVAMSFRPIRNDYGTVYDPKTTSVTRSVGAGVDVGPALTHIGVNLALNHAKSTSGKWDENFNSLSGPTEFQTRRENSLYEPWYFKAHGEQTAEPESTHRAIGGDDAIRVRLSSAEENPAATTSLEKANGSGAFGAPSNSTINRSRKPRAQLVTSITNKELRGSSGSDVARYLRVVLAGNIELSRPTAGDAKDHFAGHIVTTNDGLRYIYALPVYNHRHEDLTFSARKTSESPRTNVNSLNGSPGFRVSGTDEFLKWTKLPPYVHSHMLTAIVGPDYVDVGSNGLDDADLGYWVKFTYKRGASGSPYKWRDPYKQAHFHEGWKSDTRDDRASFSFGERELFYLARAETKSHIAEFVTVVRNDGYGANDIFQDNDAVKGTPLEALKEIRLYSRYGSSLSPIKTVKFNYAYTLCEGVENGLSGKLTLKSVQLVNGSSKRGEFSPYVFEYNNETTDKINYSFGSYDRWGVYKPGSGLSNLRFPYSLQEEALSAEIHRNAAAWNLNRIVLPSGAEIRVDYESDDYAFVQNKPAMQMVQLVDPYSNISSLKNEFELADDGKVRFKLEKPISVNQALTLADQANEVIKYIDADTWQLYFKTLIHLKEKTEVGRDEFVSGYARIKKENMQLEPAFTQGVPSHNYTHACFYLELEDAGTAGNRHPFKVRAWQHLRTNQPELADFAGELKKLPENNVIGKVEQITKLTGVANEIRKMAMGFNKFCNDKKWGRTVIGNQSWVRLNSPDLKKYGGGYRVRQITISDSWDAETVYGNVYVYETSEGGKTISSGVASYEPLAGGEENALRYAKPYVQSIPLRSDNNLFFEYPINEAFYPGPQVGYSKVTVLSLPSAVLGGVTATRLPTSITNRGEKKFGTSGKVVHEFYTARDFPVITDETDKLNRQFRLSVPIPLLGHVSIVKLTCSQGYSIITNDMHGKPKMVSNYRQRPDGSFDDDAISWLKYNYRSADRTFNKKKVKVLDNLFYENSDGTVRIPTPAEAAAGTGLVHLGQELEVFHDMRQYEDVSWEGGVRANTDILYIPILAIVLPVPIPTVLPGVSKSTTRLRTVVTNKVIFRTGILESVEAFDGGSLVKTENVKWDKVTAVPVVTSVNNNFDQKVFTYSALAHREYKGMGAAYQNAGLTFSVNSVQQKVGQLTNYIFTPSDELPANTLMPGDEIILSDIASGVPVALAVYTGIESNQHLLDCETVLTQLQYKGMILRSGFRNQLTVKAGSITRLGIDPTQQGEVRTYQKTISVPFYSN